MLRAVACSYEKGHRTNSATQLNIASLVTYDEGVRWAEPQFLCFLQSEARFGFATITPVIGMVGTRVDAVEHDIALYQRTSQTAMDGLEPRQIKIAPRKRGFVGDHGEPRARLI